MFRIYCIGLSILIVAIFLNAAIQKLGIMGWYDFLEKLQSEGRKTFAAMGPIDYVWLFVAYPFLLGLAYQVGDKLYKTLF